MFVKIIIVLLLLIVVASMLVPSQRRDQARLRPLMMRLAIALLIVAGVVAALHLSGWAPPVV